ncbi:MAG: transporter [Xanthobacteraceae bacterium]
MRRAHAPKLFRCLVAAAGLAVASPAMADENGISFWLPGIFGSLIAAPQTPGWSLTSMYYHTSVAAGGNVARSREITIGQFPVGLTASVDAQVRSDVEIALMIPTYTFATPFLGGQATVGLMTIFGRNNTSIAGTLNGTLTGPGGGVLPFSRADAFNSTLTGYGDLYPQFFVRWNQGVHNYMTYVTGDIPVGAYDPTRLANLGIGHGAVDAGVGYTYFNPETGHEFSAVVGATYNFKNYHTDYQSGIDTHLDWGWSQFLSKQVMVGLVGYVYKQATCDSGSGDRVGCFLSQVIGVGPQIGFIIPVGTTTQAYLNLKSYKEFDGKNRPDGWNAWVSLTLSPAAAPPPPPRRMATK